MSKPKAPTPPDPTATANAQTQSNLTTATNNSYLNNVNQVTPFGTVDYNVSGTGPNGVPRWTQTTTLSPEQQHLYDLQTQQSGLLGQLGIDQTNHVADILGTNYNPERFNTNAVTGGPLDINSSLGDYNGDVEARSRELLNRGLGDAVNRGQEALDSRLANQGINAGASAWGDAQRSFQAGVGDAYAQNELAARQQAQSDRQQSLSELLGQRSTNLGEAQQQYGYDTTADLAARETPLQEINSLANGVNFTPINPSQPNSYNIAGTDVAGITQNAYAQQLARYQAQLQAQNGLLGSFANLGAAAITHSDPRLKHDVSYSHTDAKGLRWWWFRYLWEDEAAPRHFGVMADEAPAHAVHTDPHSGFAVVNYAAL